MSLPRVALLVSLLAFSAVPAAAMMGGSATPSQPTDIDKARELIEKGRPADAVPLLDEIAKRTPNNADAYNLLGYAHRKLGAADKAEAYYDQALAINPKHLGALEYLGELYLETGRLDRARQILDRLDKACFFGCKEYDELKAAVAKAQAAKR